jgi:hypothetical protein
MKLIKLYRKSGNPIEVNEHSLAHGLAQGWTREEKQVKKPIKKAAK